ncbi:MAG: YidC/Oxa1 family membrane protein insertase [Candidatus Midichloriaceae bacterium]|jgi:YidC/Oxa1 family membrane protein insertase
MNNNIRTAIAAVLSMVVLVVWQFYFDKAAPQKEIVNSNNVGIDFNSENNKEAEATHPISRKTIIETSMNDNNRVVFNNGVIKGSINLVGAKIDDLVLLKYKNTIKKGSEDVVLLSPAKTKEVYYAEFGWLSTDKNLDMPDNKTVWASDKKYITSSEKLNLRWENKQGIEFTIKIGLDENYLFHIEQKAVGNGSSSIKFYSGISRSGNDIQEGQMLIHEGAIGVFNDKLEEITFEKLSDKKSVKFEDQNGGWFGFSDKYWLTAIISKDSNLNSKFSEQKYGNGKRYQATGIIDNNKIDNNISYNEVLFFAGAKELKLLDEYEKQYNIKLFDRAVDFGILYFITKPIFLALNFLYSLCGNFGIAIILLTVFIKFLLFPLAYKGFKGMNKLKELQPEMERMKKLYDNDSAKMQKGIIELYKKEKVNPMSGCLPIILQMPVFFALYKVLYVTLEMRHAKFFWWIKDLSAIDPTNIFTAFGLINWDPPSFLLVGVLPIIMALTMYLQQRLNPQPSDPTQAKVMKLLPVIFLFMFASFPSGLVLYWSWSNILSITQQVLIKRLTKK